MDSWTAKGLAVVLAAAAMMKSERAEALACLTLPYQPVDSLIVKRAEALLGQGKERLVRDTIIGRGLTRIKRLDSGKIELTHIPPYCLQRFDSRPMN